MKQLFDNFKAALTGGDTNQIIEAAFYLDHYSRQYPSTVNIYPPRYRTLLSWARRIILHGID
jgi:hypothetical protein